MMKGGHGQTNQLHDVNWVHSTMHLVPPQLMSCNYYVCVCVCVCFMHACESLPFLLKMSDVDVLD